jgi:stress-induced morphogen
MKEWLKEFIRQVSPNSQFLEEMSTQLELEFETKTGVRIDEKFLIMNREPEGFVIRKDGNVSYFKADLISPKFNDLLIIAWTGVGQAESPMPTNEVKKGEIFFWWHDLPSDEIRKAYHKKIKNNFKVPKTYFPVIYSSITFPHVTFDVYTKVDSRENLNKIYETLTTAIDDWNKDIKDLGHIHNMFEKRILSKSNFIIDIDFGSAGFEGLKFLLRKINTEAFQILKVDILSQT